MILYHIIQYSLLLIICIYLVNYYSGKNVSFHVKLWSVITWVLNFAIALLVPQDVYLTLNPDAQNDNMIQKQQKMSTLGWQYLVLYWLVYLLTWTIIPVLQEWQNSGDLESSDRLKRSLKVNGVFYLWMIIGAVIALVFLLWFDIAGQMGLIKFLQCLATIWGLLLLMGLMGYALVQIPKTLWCNADPNHFLTYLYVKVNQVQDQLQQSYQQFTKIMGYILHAQNQAKKVLNQQSQKILLYCQQSKKLIPAQYQQKINYKKNYFQFLTQIGYLQQYPLGLQSSIEHLRLIKRTIAQCKRLQRSLDYYCKTAILYEDILRSKAGSEGIQLKDVSKKDGIKQFIDDDYLTQYNSLSKNLIQTGSYASIEDNLRKNKEQQARQLNQMKNNPGLKTVLFKPKWYHNLWYLTLRQHVNKLLAIIIGTCSIILLIAQTQVFFTNKVTILGWLLSIKNYELLRIVVFIVIVFIMYMVNYSLFRLKLSNLYGLYYKDSDGPSLMFATVNFSRVGVVIVLNFFDMMKMDSQYQHVMGTVNMGLLGDWVIKGLPGVLWLIVLTHYFNVWGKLVDLLKLDNSLTFSSHDVKQLNVSNKSLKSVQKKRKQLQQKLEQKEKQNNQK